MDSSIPSGLKMCSAGYRSSVWPVTCSMSSCQDEEAEATVDDLLSWLVLKPKVEERSANASGLFAVRIQRFPGFKARRV